MFDWNQFAMTPVASLQFPIHKFETTGHTATGRGLTSGTLGVALGRTLEPWIPSLYLSGSYSYDIVENVMQYSLDQRQWTAAAGYSVTRALTIGSNYSYAQTVSGFDWAKDQWYPEMGMMHDVIAKVKVTHVGGFATYTMASGRGVFLSYTGTPSGENTHAVNTLTIGANWNFSPRWAPNRAVR